MTALVWQAPTAWSWETTDGRFYVEREPKARFWTLYHRGQTADGMSYDTADGCKAHAQRIAEGKP